MPSSCLTWEPPAALAAPAAQLVFALRGTVPDGNPIRLENGNDGLLAAA